jgi:hypothetical protein
MALGTMPDVIRRGGAAWRTFWFRGAPFLDLAVARIIVAATALHLNAAGFRFASVAYAPPALWKPIPLVAALGLAKPDLTTLTWLAHASRVALYAALFGILSRPALAVAFVLQLWQEAYLQCFGKVTHGTIPLLWAMVFLACAPCGRRLSVDAVLRRRGAARALAEESTAARWPLELFFVELAAFYFQAGFAKLSTSGLAWADGYTLQYYLIDKGVPAGMWLATSLPLCRAFSVLVLAFELTFPVAVVVRRLRPAYLVGGVLFHLGTTWLMNVSFFTVWILYLVFVPWTRVASLVAHVARRMPAPRTAVRPP